MLRQIPGLLYVTYTFVCSASVFIVANLLAAHQFHYIVDPSTLKLWCSVNLPFSNFLMLPCYSTRTVHEILYPETLSAKVGGNSTQGRSANTSTPSPHQSCPNGEPITPDGLDLYIPASSKGLTDSRTWLKLDQSLSRDHRAPTRNESHCV